MGWNLDISNSSRVVNRDKSERLSVCCGGKAILASCTHSSQSEAAASSTCTTWGDRCRCPVLLQPYSVRNGTGHSSLPVRASKWASCCRFEHHCSSRLKTVAIISFAYKDIWNARHRCVHLSACAHTHVQVCVCVHVKNAHARGG